MNKSVLENKILFKSKNINDFLLSKYSLIYAGIPLSFLSSFLGSRLALDLSELFPQNSQYPLWDFAQTMQNIEYSLIGAGIGFLSTISTFGYYKLKK
jgi:hypothetical protein